MDDKAETATIDVEKNNGIETKSASKTVSLQELQSWWEVPSIAHFCSLFRTAFDLPDFDIEDLEIALLESMKEDENFFLTDLLCRLLKGYYGRDDIQPYNMEIYLKDTIKYNWEMLEKREHNPLANGSFKDLPVRTRVEILQCLCDYRLDATDVMDQLKGLDGDNMRVEPLGKDGTGNTYWYFYGNRLYCEHPEPVKEEPKTEKKDKKNSKKKEKKKEKEQKKQQKTKPKKGKKKVPDPPRRSSRGRILKNSKQLEIDRSETESEKEEEDDISSGSDSEMDVTLSEISDRNKTNKGKDSNTKKRQSNEDDEDEKTGEDSHQTKDQKQSDGVAKGRGKQRQTPTNKSPLTEKSNKLNVSTPSSCISTRSTRRNLRNTKRDEVESISKDEEKDNDHEDENIDDEDNRDVDENSMMSESIADSTRNDDESIMCESKEGSINGDVDNIEEVKKITPRSTAHSEAKRESITDGSTENKATDSVTAKEEQSEAVKEPEKDTAEENSKDNKVKDENTNHSNCNGDIENKGKKENVDLKEDEQKEDRVPLCLRSFDPDTRWRLICETYEDWKALAESLKDSKVKCEKELYKCIIEDFLPAIPDIMVARENERKRREAEMAPRRISARIERKRREQLEQEKILAEALIEEQKARFAEREEEERRQKEENEKEEKKAREERQKSREERAKRLALREQRAQLIAEGKEIPPELMYVANPSTSKYVDTEDNRAPFELDEETVEAMHNVLESIKAHRDAWPFMEPVSKEDAPDYYDIIKKPMDLSTMEDKLTNREYRNKRKFISDFNLMLDNCRVYNGMDNDFTVMAQRLQKAFYKQVQVHLDKLQTGYEADTDFRVGRSIESSEKRYRPKRAASSRAMDTLHRAMDDAEFEDMTRSSDEEDSDSRSQSPKVIMYSRRKITNMQNRLIPELTPQQKLDQIVKDQISQHLNQKKQQRTLEWNPEKGTVQFNGQEKFAPYQLKGQVTPDGKRLTLQTAQVIRHNGKTIVYSYGKPKKISQDGSQHTSNSQETASPSTGQILAQHQQSGGTVKLTPSLTSQLQGKQFTVQTSLGPRIIKIADPVTSARPAVSSPAIQTPQAIQTVQSASPVQASQPPGQAPTQTVRISGMLGSKTITVVDGMLCVDGQKINIPVAGKTRIVYQGAVGAAPSSPNVRVITTAAGKITPIQAAPRPTLVPSSNQATVQLPQGQGQVTQQASQSVLSSVKDKIVAQLGQNQVQGQTVQTLNPIATISIQGQGSPAGLSQVTIPALKTAGQANARGIVNIPAINRPGSAIKMIGASEQPLSKGLQRKRLLPELSPSSGLSGYMPSNVSDNTANNLPNPQNVASLLPTTVLNINKFMNDEVCMQPGGSASSVQLTGINASVIAGSQSAIMTNAVGNNMLRTQVVSSNQAKGQLEQSVVNSSPLKRKAPDQQAGGTPPKLFSLPSTSQLDLSVVSGHLTDTQKANLIRLLKAKHMLATGSSPDQSQISSDVPSGGEVLSNMNQNNVSATPEQQTSVIQTTGQAGSLNQNTIQVQKHHSPIKENLFDKLQTILSSSSSAVVNSNSCVSTVSQPLHYASAEGSSQDDPPPVLTPEVQGLSPKYKDKVSLFAANLQSTSLASKLQVLSKSPTKTTNSPIQYVATSPDNTSRAIVIGQLSPSLQNHIQNMQAARQANQNLQDLSQTLAGQTIPAQGVTGVLTSGGQTILSQNIIPVNNGSELSGISNSNIISVNEQIVSLPSAANPLENNPQSLPGPLPGNPIPVQESAEYFTSTLSSPILDSGQGNESNQCIDVHVSTGQPGATGLPHTSIGNIILPIFNSSSTASQNSHVDQNPPPDSH